MKDNSSPFVKNLKEGWMYKWTNYVQSWKKRYFILNNQGRLLYSNSQSGPFQPVPLLGSRIRIYPGDSRRMDILTPNNTSIFLKTSSTAEKSSWYALFKQVQSYGNENISSVHIQSPFSSYHSLPEISTTETTSSPPSNDLTNFQNPSTKNLNLSVEKTELSSSNVVDMNESASLPNIDVNEPTQSNFIEGSEHSDILSNMPLANESELNDNLSLSPSQSDHNIISPYLNDESLEIVKSRSSLRLLTDNLSAFEQHMEGAFKSIETLQSTLLDDIKKLNTHQFSAGKERFVKLLDQINLIHSLINCFITATNSYIKDEQNEQEQLQNSIKWLAKKCYAYERLLQTTDKNELTEASMNIVNLMKSEIEEEDADYTSLIEFFDCDEFTENNSQETTDSQAYDPYKEVDIEFEKPPNNSLFLLSSDDYQDTVAGFRTSLPCKMKQSNMSAWSVLKDCVGRDLTRISMPVAWNEPTSFLQRMAEDFQYEYLLKKASQSSDPLHRLALVSIFAASPYASAIGRLYKPFNPLLGETYEMSHRGFKFISEQVSHHPPITAYHVIGEGYTIWGHLVVKTGLNRASLKMSLPGPVYLSLPKENKSKEDKIIYSRPDILVHNIILGNLWTEIDGTICVCNSSSGDYALLQFIPKGWLNNKLFRFRGVVLDRTNSAHFYLFGFWNFELFIAPFNSPLDPSLVFKKANLPVFNPIELAADASHNSHILNSLARLIDWNFLENNFDEKHLAWRAASRPSNSEDYYAFGYFTLEMNEINLSFENLKTLPPTDSRNRPDQSAYEKGNIELAQSEKLRLEDKQRISTLTQKAKLGDYTPYWFECTTDPTTNNSSWIYKGNYWDSKLTNNFSNCPDIF